ncbi:hypothetical protein ACFS5L_05860 [Streptomyces phyllanthi]|uniref:Uncharacterized protein n=1 Tax=Streptomyces phyllanthi TaxID=1803180 RepID=A0A5N8VYL4_9ACTN|nr:hypothetical protein [Streptomyces phyllanthi]MPY39128.1 hypothetical protein [Streptomyces phyllanthi]
MTGNHVASSVEAAAQALDRLEQSLRAGGFPEGTTAYECMAEVLLAQRLFPDGPSATGPDPAVLRGFEQIGTTAGRIYGLLQPYVAVMRRLAALAPAAAVDAAPAAPAVPPDVSAAVLAALRRRGRRGASVSVLCRTTGLAAGVVEAALDALVGHGIARTRDGGGVRSFFVHETRGARG